MSPATVATSTTAANVSYPFQRHGFYAAGRFWSLYTTSNQAYYESTTDPADWSGAATSIGSCTYGHGFSVRFDGTYVHYVRFSTAWDLHYRRGIPQSNGSITWSAVEQTVYSGTFDDYYAYPTITVDTSGYAWIGLQYFVNADNYPYILKNADNDGTWTTDFATKLSTTSSGDWLVCPVSLTSAKVYVFYWRYSQAPLGKLYDAGWGVEESDLADYNIGYSYTLSAATDGDDVYFVYNRNVTWQIRYNKRTFGVGWGANDVLVQDSVTDTTSPTLSIDTDTGDLYCFWTSITTDHVYYKKYSSGAWGGLVDWINESVDDIEFNFTLCSYYQAYGGYIGLLYVTELASPYKVRFAFLRMGWTGKISGITNPAKIMGIPVAGIAKVKGIA